MIQKISNNQPSFHGKLILSNFADNIVNERFRKMPSALRTKALEEYDQFIHKVINSKYEVKVSQLNKKDLCATVNREGEKDLLAYTEDRNNLIAKLGFRNPVKFMQKAFERAKKNDLL